ncbi:hypothetical protein [Acidovorax sp. LjRoot117]|uniref:hypothetical protein n=1 Tax=Acidovorax sp. LjRoot117 TaxID=3342255 RepID=UPI003ECEAC62
MTDDQIYRLDQLERSASEASATLHAIEAQMQRWEDNQKWQINDLRDSVKTGLAPLNTASALVIGLLVYIAYRLS